MVKEIYNYSKKDIVIYALVVHKVDSKNYNDDKIEHRCTVKYTYNETEYESELHTKFIDFIHINNYVKIRINKDKPASPSFYGNRNEFLIIQILGYIIIFILLISIAYTLYYKQNINSNPVGF